MPTPNGGTAVSISNTPQAKNDTAGTGEDGVLTINVLANDLGGAAKHLYSVDQVDPLHALTTSVSKLGATISIVDGQIVYDSTGAAALQALALGETATDTFTYVIQLGNGTLSTATVSVTVTGANDAPVLSADSTAVHPLTELGDTTGSTTADTAAATLAFHDLDLSDTHTVSLGAPHATYLLAHSTDPVALASLPLSVQTALNDALGHALTSTLTDSTHTGAGSIALAFSAADKAFDFLAKGETLSVTYDVTVTDNNGATSTQPVTFTVTGTNDAPVVAADAGTHAITETAATTGDATAHTLAGSLAFTDADLSDTHTVTIGAPAAVWSNGTTPAGTLAALNGALTSALTDSTHTGAGSVGLSFSAADNAFDFLAAGETLTVTYNVTVTDENGASSTKPVTVTVTGSNDAPVLSVVDPNFPVSEHPNSTGDTAVSQDGATTLTFTDVDLSDHHTVSVAAPSLVWSGGDAPAGLATALTGALTTSLTPVGGLQAHDSTGTGQGVILASFAAPDADFDFLAAGETLKVTYDVTVDDGHGGTSTQPVTITITGSNDTPVITAANAAGAITEDANPAGVETASGTVAFGDADLTDHHTVSSLLASTTGSHAYGALAAVMTTDADGHGVVTWTYTANDSALQSLAAGETVTETYTVKVDDGHGGTVSQDVVVTLTGTNDAPVVAGDVTGAATEGGAGVGLNALAHATDVDDGAVLSVTGLPDTLPPGVTFDAATHTFTLDPTNAAYDHLAAGATQVVTVSYGVTDGMATTPATVSWTVTGTNDAPVVSGALSGAATEGGPAATLDALANAHDVDDGAVLSVTGLPATLPAGVTYDAGTHSFTLDPTNTAYDHLAVGETQTVTVDYAVSDGIAAPVATSVSWTVTGTNDAPVLSAPGSQPELLVNGGFEQGATGWTNTAGGVEVGPAGVYGVSGASGAVMELDVNGNSHDDVSQTVATTAGTAYTFAFDVAQRAGTTPASNTFEVVWNGQVIDTITPGSTAMEHHSYTVGATGASGTVEFVETGTDDSLGTIIDNVSLKASGIQEQAGQTGSGAIDTYATTLSFTDVDLHDVHAATSVLQSLAISGGGSAPADLASALSGALSTAVTETNGAGSVAATFNAADSVFDFLQAGQTLTLTYDVTVDDHHGGTSTQPVTITVTGTDDAPVVANAIGDQSATMLQAFNFTPSASTFDDVDNSSLTWSATQADGSALPSWLHFNAATHSFSGTPAGADVGGFDVKVTASDGTLSTSDTFHLTVGILNQTLVGTSNGEQISGDVGADTITGNGGNDTLLGGAGSDVIYGDATGAQGPAPSASFALSAVAQADLTHGNTLVTPGGGTTFTLPTGDDNFSGAIDVTSVFGSQGLNFFGHDWTTLYVNNNGNLTFGSPNGSYTPTSIAAGSTPIIAPFWADVMTNFAGGGTVTYNLDATNGVFTATWDHVGYYAFHSNPTDTFQLQLINEGGGNFDIVFRYQAIGWTTGDASGGVGGLGGSVARAGYNSGTGTEFEIPESANQAQMLALPTESNVGIPGVFEFHVRNGVVTASNADVVDGGAGADTLTGGSGPDTFVFHQGQANGDVVTDFNPGDGDKVLLVGYGAGATFTEVDPTHWEVNYGAGLSQHEVITFLQAPPIQVQDYSWASSAVF